MLTICNLYEEMYNQGNKHMWVMKEPKQLDSLVLGFKAKQVKELKIFVPFRMGLLLGSHNI